MKLSILIPAVFDRQSWLIYNHLLSQADGKDVEILALFDNRKRSIGAKRQALLDAANGDFICHLDDDDWVSDDYIDSLLGAISSNPTVDVITFGQECSLNDEAKFKVRICVTAENEQPWQLAGVWQDIHRKPWMWCCWRRRFANRFPHPQLTAPEDRLWLELVWPHILTYYKMDKVLHFYRYNKDRSLAWRPK